MANAVVNAVGAVLARFVGRYLPAGTGADAIPLPPSASPRDSATTLAQVDAVRGAALLWRQVQDRCQRHALYDRMDDEDEFVEEALDAFADVATTPTEDGADARRSFEIVVKSSGNDAQDKEAQQTLEDCAARVGLRERQWEYGRDVEKYGNVFAENVVGNVGGQMMVVRLKDLPEETLWPRRDEFGRPLSPAWEQRTLYTQEGKGVLMDSWQITHWVRGGGKTVFGRSLMHSARHNWTRLQLLEDSMAVARLVRAYQKLAHYIPVADTATQDEIRNRVENYKRQMTLRSTGNSTAESLDGVADPLAVMTDFYFGVDSKSRPKLGVESVDPNNPQLQNLRDMEYARARLLAKLEVPMRFLNLGGSEAAKGSLSDGGLSREEEQFLRKCRRLQSILAEGDSRILNLDLILHGVNPLEVDYEIIFPLLSMNDAERQSVILQRRMQALSLLSASLAGNLPLDYVLDEYLKLTPEEKERWFNTQQERFVAKTVAAIKEGRTDRGFIRSLEEMAESLESLVAMEEAARGNGKACAHEAAALAYP